MEKLLDSLRQDLLRALAMLGMLSDKQKKLYDTAYSFLGSDASPADFAPDELGCAESMSRVLQKAFPDIQFPTLLSTRDLYDYFTASPSFNKATEEDFGLIILSVTGMGNGNVTNGHVGVMGKYASFDGTPWIMSNDSRTGTWEASLTLDQWNRHYRSRGGMATLFYRVV